MLATTSPTLQSFMQSLDHHAQRVQVLDNRVVVWQKPDTPNGNITGYEVGISTTPEPTPDQITIAGRINDAEQNFFAINRDDVSASIAYVQVR